MLLVGCSFLQRTTRAFTASTVKRRSLSIPRLGATLATSFDDGERPYQITTPIYYVNDKPHIGHAYTSTGEFVRPTVELLVK